MTSISPPMRPLRQRLAGLVLASGLLAGGAGCADQSPTPGGTTPGGTPSMSTNPSGSPTGRPSLTPLSPSAKPSASGAALTVSGAVERGVEQGCLILRTSGEVYLLVGGDRSALTEGARVRVTGRLNPGLMTTCQQGTPLMVDTITPE